MEYEKAVFDDFKEEYLLELDEQIVGVAADGLSEAVEEYLEFGLYFHY